MFSPSTPAHASRLNKKVLTALFICICVPNLQSCAEDQQIRSRPSRIYEAWDVINQPSRFGRQFETRFDKLPRGGELGRIPWSDYYWPSQRAGIAYRWLNPSLSPFTYSFPTRQIVQSMSRDQLAALSPAEKLDIYTGRYDFPTALSERRRTSPNAAAWEGLCHGWAPAALEFSEPSPVTLSGSGGIDIPFGASDVKALLSWFMAQHGSTGAIGLGSRCNLGGSIGMSTSACRDANAGAFHIVLANMVGRFKEGFIIDLARAAEVWNQPVFAFRSREVARQQPSPGAAAGTRQEVIVESEVRYTIEVEPQWNALGQLTERPAVSSVLYRYRLELDTQGAIRGGEWLQEARPDFLWLQERPPFSGVDAAIGQIYEASLR